MAWLAWGAGRDRPGGAWRWWPSSRSIPGSPPRGYPFIPAQTICTHLSISRRRRTFRGRSVRQRHQSTLRRSITGSTRSRRNCNVCHQFGNKSTREIPVALGMFPSSVAAWDLRVQGRDRTARGMSLAVTVLGRARGIEMFANWTDCITAGEVPRRRVRRVSSGILSRRCGTGRAGDVRAQRPGERQAEYHGERLRPDSRCCMGNDGFLTLDTRAHREGNAHPGVDPENVPGTQSTPVPSPVRARSLTGLTRPSPMRRWTARRRSACLRTSRHSAETIRSPHLRRCRRASGADSVHYDPKTQQFKQVGNISCFDVHHVHFASDADEMIYGSGPFKRADRLGEHDARGDRRCRAR